MKRFPFHFSLVQLDCFMISTNLMILLYSVYCLNPSFIFGSTPYDRMNLRFGDYTHQHCPA